MKNHEMERAFTKAELLAYHRGDMYVRVDFDRSDWFRFRRWKKHGLHEQLKTTYQCLAYTPMSMVVNWQKTIPED